MNSLYEGPRSMHPEEYDQVMDLKEIAYGSTRQHFFNSNPYNSKRENFVFGEHFVIKEDKKIVSHMRLLPLTVIINDCRIIVGAIGDVATHPDYQGRGYMGKLLRYSVEKMKERRIPISILWGDTQRYRHFGWETGGRKIVFYLNKRSTKKVKMGKEFMLRGYNSKVDLDKVIAIHERESLRVERTKKDYEGILKRMQIQIWMGNKGNSSSYAVLNNNVVVEFGGKPSLVTKLFSFLLSHYPLNALYVPLPYIDTEMLRSLYKVSSSWQISPLGMIKVIDLKKTLLSFASEIQEKAEIFGIPKGSSVTLKIKNTHQRVTLVKKNKIEIRSEESKNIVPLSEVEIVRLLFGLSPERFGKNEKQKRFLRAIFPLHFFVWWLDHI